MAEIKQTATCGIWKVDRHVDNKIDVYKNGQLCDKSAPALREIAVEIGLEVNPEWRTSQLGANVVKAILLDATPAEIQQEEEKKLQAQSLTDGRFMFPIHELYDGKNINTKLLRPIPFIYRCGLLRAQSLCNY